MPISNSNTLSKQGKFPHNPGISNMRNHEKQCLGVDNSLYSLASTINIVPLGNKSYPSNAM